MVSALDYECRDLMFGPPVPEADLARHSAELPLTLLESGRRFLSDRGTDLVRGESRIQAAFEDGITARAALFASAAHGGEHLHWIHSASRASNGSEPVRDQEWNHFVVLGAAVHPRAALGIGSGRAQERWVWPDGARVTFPLVIYGLEHFRSRFADGMFTCLFVPTQTAVEASAVLYGVGGESWLRQYEQGELPWFAQEKL